MKTGIHVNILLIGAGISNKGAEAMMHAARVELDRRLGPQRWLALMTEPVNETQRLRLEKAGITVLASHPALNPAPRRSLARAGLLRVRRKLSSFGATPAANADAGVDAVLDISGYAYGDPWRAGSAKTALRVTEYCRRTNKPYLFLPQAWGPFEKPEILDACARACRSARLVVARDDVSREHLSRLPGVDPARIVQAPDIAFLFAGSGEQRGREIMDRLRVDCARPVVGIAPNMKVYQRTAGSGEANRYVQVLMEICRYLRAQDADVLLIPHHAVDQETGALDDRILGSLVAAHMADPRVVSWNECPSAADIKSVMAHLDLLVGSRFHALVGTLSSGVPVFALSWSHKYQELLRPFHLDRYVVGVDGMEAETLMPRLREYYQQRETLREDVRAALPVIRRKVERFFDEAAEILVKHHSPRGSI